MLWLILGNELYPFLPGVLENTLLSMRSFTICRTVSTLSLHCLCLLSLCMLQSVSIDSRMASSTSRQQATLWALDKLRLEPKTLRNDFNRLFSCSSLRSSEMLCPFLPFVLQKRFHFSLKACSLDNKASVLTRSNRLVYWYLVLPWL